MKAPTLVKARIKGKHFNEMQEGDIICFSFGDERSRDIPFQIKVYGEDFIRLERWRR